MGVLFFGTDCMITKEEIQELLHSTETYRVERTTSTGNMDKFQEAICAFANDLPNSRKNGYLILGAYDNGELSGLKVTDEMVSNYPYQAIRELLLNACMHRDMQSNTPLRFYEYARHLEILNAGGLYGNARPENFPSVNDYRNPLVASAMKTLGYVNMFNRGVGQVQIDLKENGNQPAEFNVNLITAFKVEVEVAQNYVTDNGGNVGGKNGGIVVENVVGKDHNDVETPSDVVENVVENKENVVENILASISKNSTISTKELAAMCSLSERQVQRIMTKLKEQRVIRRIGPDKGGHWEIIAP